MKTVPRALTLLLVVAAVCLRVADAADPEYSLSISAGPGAFKRGAEVKLRIVITNLTDHQISIGRLNDTSGPEFEYTFNIRDSQARNVGLTRYGRASHGSPDPGDTPKGCGDCAGFAQDIGTHEKTTDEVSLSKIYDFSTPGKYRVQVSRSNDDGRKTLVKSNTITITITD